MTFQHPIITLEEHWCSQHVRDFYKANNVSDPNDEDGLVGIMTPALMDFSPEQRLKKMDDNGVSMQVVSHVSNTIPIDSETCSKANNELASLIAEHPTRFAGFALLPMSDPKAAAREFGRCVKELKFVGTLIDSNTEGRFYDEESFWPVFQTAEELDVPVYIHPAPNERTEPLLYQGNYPQAIGQALSQFGWGWHSETATCFLRMFSSGLFDRHPRLKIVLGHMGEMLPFQLDRIEAITNRFFPHVGVNLNRGLRQVWDENVWITTSGMFSLAPMATVVRQCKKERVMFSVDYPFTKNELGVKFLKELKEDGMADIEGLERIAWKNAAALLKVKVDA